MTASHRLDEDRVVNRLEPSCARRLADVAASDLAARLTGDGLWLDLGATTLRLRCEDPRHLAPQIQQAYGAFPLQERHTPWADLHVHLRPVKGLRRWIKPQVAFETDGQYPFEAFPADMPLPLLEWGSNWLIGQRMNHCLLFHAGAVERSGHVLLMPAMPGSGKSTLTAALVHRGFRLLSDEFGCYDLSRGCFVPVLKPVALKNTSIEVIRRFAPQARFGPEFPGTRKGTVAHMAAPAESVDQRFITARPGAIILPRWQAGRTCQLEDFDPAHAFSQLAFNAFNYALTREHGFRAVAHLVRTIPCWNLVYSDLEEAVATILERWDGLQAPDAQHAAPPPNEHAQPDPAQERNLATNC